MIVTKEDKEIIKRLYYTNNYAYADIGKLFSISRQRVHQIITGYKTLDDASRIRKYTDMSHCKLCPNKGVNIHHIDSNSHNNKSSNLIVLCTKCHNKVHTKKYRVLTITNSSHILLEV